VNVICPYTTMLISQQQRRGLAPFACHFAICQSSFNRAVHHSSVNAM